MNDKTLVERLRILRDYLNGIGPLERKWFGDDVGRNAHPTRRFWWRKELAAITEAANTIEAQATRIEALEAEKAQAAKAERGRLRELPIGAWLSAALDDPSVCEEMKADIRTWFDALESQP